MQNASDFSPVLLSGGALSPCSRDSKLKQILCDKKQGTTLGSLPIGTPSGARTLDTLIKSQVLYQLS